MRDLRTPKFGFASTSVGGFEEKRRLDVSRDEQQNDCRVRVIEAIMI